MFNEITSLITLVETYLTWLSSLPGKLAALLMPIVFIVLAVLEFACPHRSFPVKPLCRSYLTNLGLFVFNGVAVWLLSAATLLSVADRYSGWGLLNRMDNPAWKALLSLLALDLLHYAWHRASHCFDWLWQFHKVHHNDPYMNVSTAFRLHIVELLIIIALKSACVMLLGIDKGMVAANETLIALFVMFHHTNVSFYGERSLGHVIVVPYLHRAHHSTERSEHDNNYGAVFSLWDRLFGTFLEREPMKLGIKNDTPQTVWGLVKFGFIPASPASVSAEPTYGLSLDIKAMIAEAAYYKAEKRAFKPGNELRDWLEAKREIIGMVYDEKAFREQQNDSGRSSIQQRPFTLC